MRSRRSRSVPAGAAGAASTPTTSTWRGAWTSEMHSFATRWKAAQGSDDGLMAIAGWSSRTMIDRYTGAAAAGRAADEARALGLADL
jgi:hypothetical protein